MKTTIAILALLLATAAIAAPMYDPSGVRHETPPTKVGDTHNVTPEMLVADGWTYETQAQAAEYAAQVAQAQADAEAQAAQFTFPAPETTVPMVDADGNAVGIARILVDRDTLEILAVIDTASPQRTWDTQKAQLKAIRASRTMKDSKLAEAATYTDAKAKKEAAAKLEKESAEVGGKKLTDKQKLDLLWKIAGMEK